MEYHPTHTQYEQYSEKYQLIKRASGAKPNGGEKMDAIANNKSIESVFI